MQQSFHTPLPAHQPGHFLNPFDRKRWQRQWFHCDTHQLHRIIICCNPIRRKCSAPFTSVNNCPLTIRPYPYRNCFHLSSTICCTISRIIIHMHTAQTIRAMIPVIRSCALRAYDTAAAIAGKTFIAGMFFVISLFIYFAFIFSIQFFVPPITICSYKLVGRRCPFLHQPPGQRADSLEFFFILPLLFYVL